MKPSPSNETNPIRPEADQLHPTQPVSSLRHTVGIREEAVGCPVLAGGVQHNAERNDEGQAMMWSTLEVYATRQLTISTLGLVVRQHHVPGSIDEPSWIVTHPE